jgi:hypothetical protein
MSSFMSAQAQAQAPAPAPAPAPASASAPDVIPEGITTVFFDDTQANIANMTTGPDGADIKAEIKGVLINEHIVNPLFGAESPAVRDYSTLDVFQNNTYAQYVAKHDLEHPSNGYIPVPDEGVNATHLAMLRNWFATNPGGRKRLIFDWDRALAVTEGYMVPAGNSTWQVSYNVSGPEDVAEYVMGGPDRLRMFQEFFRECNDLGVEVIINTNNGAASTAPVMGRDRRLYPSPRPHFLGVAQVVIPQMEDSRILSARDYGKNKFAAYRAYLSAHQGTPGGRRRTRRSYQKKRKTRRRSALRFSETARRRRR